ncbi:ribosome maturation factor RimM [Paenarthrobacter sp. Z7-10]|uniref:ribosome maturation factor RimM n=1 Tax=Paenarthrobacter sp. Z7-10 TaxID=2787635 RepID=UPI0022A8E7C0|nr:ribosome maturation factor RimM [Paenarthrobacter sp. Z7-10]MCZ2403879.1 ribosome maturation factor RimM [Paenarthrobacter sp. Z7-10]
MKVQVARIGKPHGIRGEVTVQVLTDAPEDRFVPGTELEVEPATLGPLTIEGSRWNKTILLLAFEQIQTRNEAETLRGAKVFIDSDEVEDDDDDAWYEHELVGLSARVGSEEVGKVVGLNTMPVQDLLIIEDAHGEEILVPFVTEIVPEVNIEGGYVLLTPPNGLFDVNSESAVAAPEAPEPRETPGA